MKIAIIGGGAAGMAAAYLLDNCHEITVFEKQAILGGNIRTLNKNVRCTALQPDIILDNGVVEFQRDYFPNFHKLMQHLQVPMTETPISSELFLANGHYYKSTGAIHYGCKTQREKILECLKMSPIMFNYLYFLARVSFSSPESYRNRPISAYLKNSICDSWLKMLLMYAYSIPYEKIDNFPAEIGLPLLRQSGMFTKWDKIIGGVYTYIEKILSTFQGTIHCGSRITGITRNSNAVQLTLASSEQLHFDKVIFATTPEQVLTLLKDPSENEIKCFQGWQENTIDTIIHTDTSLYKHFGVSYFCEFDLFQNDQQDCSYNAYLDRLCDVNTQTDTHFSLAYNLEKRINPETIIDTQHHSTPNYTVDAIRYRQEILATNGKNNTYHAGAYLFNGLHEGAISSSFLISELLGGIRL